MTWPNQLAAPNRRLRLGPVPWSFGTLTSQGPAVGGPLGNRAGAGLQMAAHYLEMLADPQPLQGGNLRGSLEEKQKPASPSARSD